MRNLVFVHKIEGLKVLECYVDVNRIVAIENPTGDTFKMFFENTIWDIDTNDFNNVKFMWSPYYKQIN